MTQTFVNPTYFNLQKATLRFEFQPSQRDLDVTGLIPALSLNSSINSETMYGTARVIDSSGLLENIPLRGEEQIIFEIADSKIINDSGGLQEGLATTPYSFVGFVYKIDNVVSKDTNDAVFYDIHFISYQSFKAGTYNITRSYRDLAISDIAKSVFNDYFDSKEHTFIDASQRKPFIVEETSGRARCIIPRMRPEEAMQFLTKRAYSADTSPSCTYRFFESSRGYQFVTDEHLFRLAEDDPTRVFNFTFLDAIPNTPDQFDVQLNNLESIENEKRVNSLDDLYNGAYRNKVIEIDILRRQTNLLNDDGQYDYIKERRKYFDVKKFQTIQDRHTRTFVESNHRSSQDGSRDEDIQKKFVVVTNYDRNRDDADTDKTLPADTHYAEIISNRQAYSKHIESITVNSVGPGRLDITAGDIIDLEVKKFQFADESDAGSFESNKHLSGKYIVKSVSHVMEQEEMKNYYTMIKKDWSEVITDYSDAALDQRSRDQGESF